MYLAVLYATLCTLWYLERPPPHSLNIDTSMEYIILFEHFKVGDIPDA